MLMWPVWFLPRARGVNGIRSQNKGRRSIAMLCGCWRCGSIAVVGDVSLLNLRHVKQPVYGIYQVFAVVAMWMLRCCQSHFVFEGVMNGTPKRSEELKLS
jgi:hypothetical protein